jgi:hypothetical protein
MPSYDDWSSQMSLQRQRWEGRIRTWNNTPNFGTISKDSRPINGYSDKRLKASATPTTQWLRSYPSDALLSQTNYIWDLNRVYSFYNYTMTSQSTRIGTEWGALTWNLENDLELKLLLKIADAKVNLAVMYAEASKTSDLILDTARRIDRAYRAFRRGNLKVVASELGISPHKVHKTWLEYRYGWLPLLMDVKGSAEFFAQQYIVRPVRWKASVSKKVVMALDLSEDMNPWGGPPTSHMSELLSRSLETKMVAWCELTSPHLSELQQLGLTNPSLVAWELVPFSFVFDWIISVGDWLTGLTALQGVTVLRAFTSSVLSEGYVWSSPPSDRHDAAYRYISEAQEYMHSFRHYNRVPLVLDPSSLVPPVSTNLTWKQMVSGLALLRGGYRGHGV